MDELWKSVCDSLPEGDALSKSYVKKLHHFFPVPSDYKVEWAITEQFGKKPQGLVIADKGIVMKSTQANPDDDATSTPVYFIIPWHQFDPDAYKLQVLNGQVTLTMGEAVSVHFSNLQIGAFFVKSMEKKRQFSAEKARILEASVAAELNTLGLKTTQFAAAYGADTGNTGHGIYAEEAGAILDRLSGEKVEVVGRDDAKNGADKMVNKQAVQCKYCKTANRSVNGCFKINPNTNSHEFRYYNGDGTPMMIEVPKDQYAAAIEAFKKKILDGQVPGVTDPNAAYRIIRPGKLTQLQAQNLAKAGTFESITYDAVTGAVVCSFTFGISVLTAFGFAYSSNHDFEGSLKSAASVGFQTFGLTLSSQILASQLAKTGLSKALTPLSKNIVNRLGYKTTQKLINASRALVGKRPISGISAQNSLGKALRTNAIVSGVNLVVFSIPDTYRVASKQMSTGQYTQNMTSLIASFLGANAAALASGLAMAKVAKSAGKPINSHLGKALSYGAGFLGGVGASYSTKAISSTFREDDSVIMLRLFNGVVVNVFIDNLLAEDEINQFFDLIHADKNCAKKLKSTFSSLYGSDSQYQDLETLCNDVLESILAKREKITLENEPSTDDFLSAFSDVLTDVADTVAE